jgi:hypothetical protein
MAAADVLYEVMTLMVCMQASSAQLIEQVMNGPLSVDAADYAVSSGA